MGLISKGFFETWLIPAELQATRSSKLKTQQQQDTTTDHIGVQQSLLYILSLCCVHDQGRFRHLWVCHAHVYKQSNKC